MNLAALVPFRSRNYRLLFTSTAASAMGDWLDAVAVLVLVSVVWREGAFGLAAVIIAMGAPRLAAPFVGVLVDRASPRAVMVGADLARAAATAGMVFAEGIWVLASLLAVRSVFAVTFSPAQQVALKRAVPAVQLLPANALNQVVQQGAKFVGPGVGGVLLTVLHPTTIIGINAVTFVISAAALVGLRIPVMPGPARRSTYRDELREGVRFVFRTPALRLVIEALGATLFLVLLVDAMMALAVLELGLPTSHLGYIVAAVGVGGVVGSIVLAQWGAARRPFVLIGVGQLLGGGMVALLGYVIVTRPSDPGPAWLLVPTILGLAGAGVLVGFPTVVQTVTPDHLIGRVWTAVDAVPTAMQVVAPAVGAALVSVVGVGRLYLLAGAALALLSAATLLRQRTVPIGSAQGAAAM